MDGVSLVWPLVFLQLCCVLWFESLCNWVHESIDLLCESVRRLLMNCDYCEGSESQPVWVNWESWETPTLFACLGCVCTCGCVPEARWLWLARDWVRVSHSPLNEKKIPPSPWALYHYSAAISVCHCFASVCVHKVHTFIHTFMCVSVSQSC